MTHSIVMAVSATLGLFHPQGEDAWLLVDAWPAPV